MVQPIRENSDWITYDNPEGGRQHLRKVIFNDQHAVTLRIDNYSANPVGIHRYLPENFNFRGDWSEFYREPQLTFTRLTDAIAGLAPHLGPADFAALRRMADSHGHGYR